MKKSELISYIKENILLEVKKKGDKFFYRGVEQEVIEDDGIIVRTKEIKSGRERKFNQNQINNQNIK